MRKVLKVEGETDASIVERTLPPMDWAEFSSTRGPPAIMGN